MSKCHKNYIIIDIGFILFSIALIRSLLQHGDTVSGALHCHSNVFLWFVCEWSEWVCAVQLPGTRWIYCHLTSPSIHSRFESMSFVVNIYILYIIIEIEKRHNKMVDRIRWDTVSYLPFYYVFFQFLLLTIFNLQANILTTKDILSNLAFTHHTCKCKIVHCSPHMHCSSPMHVHCSSRIHIIYHIT